jgi:hypothetical protein
MIRDEEAKEEMRRWEKGFAEHIRHFLGSGKPSKGKEVIPHRTFCTGRKCDCWSEG